MRVFFPPKIFIKEKCEGKIFSGMRHFPQLPISRKIWIVKKSKWHTAYSPDSQHFKFFLDHSETVDINNIPLILSAFSLGGESTPSRILFRLFLGKKKKTRKIALLVTKLFNNQFVFLDRDWYACNLPSWP